MSTSSDLIANIFSVCLSLHCRLLIVSINYTALLWNWSVLGVTKFVSLLVLLSGMSMCTGSDAEPQGIISDGNLISKDEDYNDEGTTRTREEEVKFIHGLLRRLPINGNLGRLPLNEASRCMHCSLPLSLSHTVIHDYMRKENDSFSKN